MIISHNLILPKYLRIVNKKGRRISKTRAREGGASVFTALFSSFRISAPPSARSKNFRAKPPPEAGRQSAGKKEGGLGEGIFARLLCPPKAGWGWEAFPPFGVKPNIKAKQFSIPFKRKKGARKIKNVKKTFWGGGERRRAAAGRSVKVRSPDFRQKKFGF